MRGRCHQQQILRSPRQRFPETETLSLIGIAVDIPVMRAHPVSFVNYRDIPPDITQHAPEIIIACDLIHPSDNQVIVPERIACRRQILHRRREDVEAKVELRGHLVLPLFRQPSGAHDDDTTGGAPQQHFTDVQARHHGFTRARIVGE